MQKRVDVLERHDDLQQTRWTFIYLNHGAVLDGWASESRKSRRHKFQAAAWDGKRWSRTQSRDNRIERPVVPKRVSSEALRIYAETLTFADGEI